MKSFEGKARVILFIVALTLFGFGTYLSLTTRSGEAIITYGAGILSLVFVFLPAFQSFEGLGIKAKLLDQKIEESDAVIKRLQKMLVLMAGMLFSLSARMGRWGSSMPRSDRYHLMEQIEKELSTNGVPIEEIENAKIDFHRYNMVDLYSPIFKRLRELGNKKSNEFVQELNNTLTTESSNKQTQIEKLTKKKEDAERFVVASENIISINDFETMPTAFDSLIKTCSFFTNEEKTEILRDLKEEISDFNYYGVHHQFRRLDVWLSKKNE